ncbi:hypothetical protein BAT02nite_01390 [Bacillus atrophaeus]|nr:hypothetical protein BAT02nite_01390 [Bacillus atrophaeus]
MRNYLTLSISNKRTDFKKKHVKIDRKEGTSLTEVPSLMKFSREGYCLNGTVTSKQKTVSYSSAAN